MNHLTNLGYNTGKTLPLTLNYYEKKSGFGKKCYFGNLTNGKNMENS